MKHYTLTDGSSWTARTLADKLNCSVSCARQRLCTHDDPARIFAPIGESMKTKYLKKAYELTEDGKVVFSGSANDIAVEFGLCESTVYSRLRRGTRSAKEVCKKPNNSMATNARRAIAPRKISEVIQRRNFFDPLSRLLLKTI